MEGAAASYETVAPLGATVAQQNHGTVTRRRGSLGVGDG
jgi:hypothetical protein